MIKSDLPFGSEFSPSQIGLTHVLELAHRHGGDWRAFEKAVQTKYFEKQNASASAYNRAKLANNTKLGMRAYGLIDDDANLTSIGLELYEIRKNPKDLYERLAKHILLNLYGTTLVQCVQDMQASGEQVSLRPNRYTGGIRIPRKLLKTLGRVHF